MTFFGLVLLTGMLLDLFNDYGKPWNDASLALLCLAQFLLCFTPKSLVMQLWPLCPGGNGVEGSLEAQLHPTMTASRLSPCTVWGHPAPGCGGESRGKILRFGRRHNSILLCLLGSSTLQTLPSPALLGGLPFPYVHNTPPSLGIWRPLSYQNPGIPGVC